MHTLRNRHRYGEISVGTCAEGYVFAESVDYHSRKIVSATERHLDLLTAVHPEVSVGITSNLVGGEFLRLCDIVGHMHTIHFVYTEMLDLFRFDIVRYQVILLVIPAKEQRICRIDSAVVTVNLLFLLVPVKILERDPFVLDQCRMDSVNTAVYALVHGLDPACGIDLSAESLCLMGTCKSAQLFYKLRGLLLRNEL